MALIRRATTGAPVTTTIVLLMAVSTSIVHLLTADPRFVERHLTLSISALREMRWWTPITSVVVAPNLAVLTASAVLLLVAVPLERRMGLRTFLTAAGVVQLLGAIYGIGTAALVESFDADWGLQLSTTAVFDPAAWVAGVAMTASADMPVLWRRRIRVGLSAGVVVLALFNGGLSDLVLLTSVAVGIALGRVVYGKVDPQNAVAGTRSESRLLVALIVFASALGPVIAFAATNAAGPFGVLEALLRSDPWTADEVRDVCTAAAGSSDCRQGLFALRFDGVGFTVLAIAPSLFLAAVSDGLRRGRRAAWISALSVQVCLTALAILNMVQLWESWSDLSAAGLRVDGTYVLRAAAPLLAPVAVALVLVSTRSNFGIVSPTGAARSALRRIGLSLLTLGTLYVATGAMSARSIAPVPELAVDFVQRLIPNVYLQWFEPALLAGELVPSWMYQWIGVVFWVTLCAIVLSMFLQPTHPDDSTDRRRAREILVGAGGSNLSWMATWKANNYWFTPDGRSFVAYRVIGGIALTTAGPVGPSGETVDAVRGFADFSSANGWTPCLYSISADTRRAADVLGWSSVQVGEEAILDLTTLTFTGKKFQDIRTSFNRAAKAGIRAEWTVYAQASPAVRDQITAISREWVAEKAMPEMGFTLGGLAEMEDPEVRCLIAVDADRTVHGVTSWLPVYRGGHVAGWTLDFMRRRSAGFGPVSEFLIASAAESFASEGFEFLSLSGAPLARNPDVRSADRSPGTSRDPDALERVLDVVGRALEPVYGFRSLLAFKSKFQPRYEPIFMSFPDSAALPSIANAVGRAYLPRVTINQGAQLMWRVARSSAVCRTGADPTPARGRRGRSLSTY
ncbi:bifunctional lysylphosphatidylglycerol flippase/synthetase MprF [Rhodococcoides corynebacterioides]|uniref:bifunctional lysylphosphatidylglycerol flippase/synthetase MprF n=1 Tax=Rhodococcoides corynebacterioides TaxID=53972 RepID=UPI003F80ECCD